MGSDEAFGGVAKLLAGHRCGDADVVTEKGERACWMVASLDLSVAW